LARSLQGGIVQPCPRVLGRRMSQRAALLRVNTSSRRRSSGRRRNADLGIPDEDAADNLVADDMDPAEWAAFDAPEDLGDDDATDLTPPNESWFRVLSKFRRDRARRTSLCKEPRIASKSRESLSRWSSRLARPSTRSWPSLDFSRL
jgi:hypothetical protein